MKHTRQDLKIMQGWSLERKIRVTQTRIMEWYMRYDGQVFISFSGGKDSTVLLDLARRVYPDIPAVYVDTGLEYPELRDFVKTKDNVIWLRPRYPFTQILEKYGYPIISKEVSDVINGARKGTTLPSGTTQWRTAGQERKEVDLQLRELQIPSGRSLQDFGKVLLPHEKSAAEQI